jgi:acetyltransferase-like isoleucine patch superfamily enzyme
VAAAEESVTVDATATVAETAILAAPYRPLLDGRVLASRGATVIGAKCWIGDSTSVGAGTTIGAGSILHGDIHVETDVTIGSRVLLTYRCWIDSGATIGDDCVIAGFICERARIGRSCRVFGSLIHAQHDPQAPWDGPGTEEEPPVLEDEAFVGWGATVIGPVVLAERAYVAAGAIVSRSVPSRHIAHGNNQVVPYDRWPGALARSPFFTGGVPDAGRP